MRDPGKTRHFLSVSRVLKQDPGTIMENLPRFSFNSFGFKSVRCFRCRESGHTFRNCNAEKRVFSNKKILRDNERLRQFIQRKTCDNFPFSSLDNSEFRKIVKQNSVFSRQVNILVVQNENLTKEKHKLENIIDHIKDQFKEKKRILSDKVENLTTENKSLRTKLQKSQSINKQGVTSIRRAEYLQDLLGQQNDTIHKLGAELNIMRITDTKYQEKICVLTARCKELERVQMNSVHSNCSNDTGQSYKSNTQHWNQNSNNRHYRGRGRRGRGKL